MAQTNANLIWKIADLLRGPYQPNQYGDVILPFTILRRLDCILEPTKDEVLAEYKKIASTKVDPDVMLKAKFKLPFYNTSRWSFASLIGDPEGVADNMVDYIEHFSSNVRDVFDGFRMMDQIADLAKSDRLYLIVREFAAVDLHPKVISGHDMGHIFEELIRKFAESNSTQAGDHFTPREVIELMVDILFVTQDDALTKPGTVRTIYDPAAGTGGMLSTAYDHLVEMNPKARPVLYGQDINPRSYALCKSDMIIKGQDVDNIYFGDTLTDDGFRSRHFDFLLSNPPFGVAWNTQQKSVTDEYEQRGFARRFGPGLPRVSDGSLLFLLHLISKMQPVKSGEGGSRLAIVLNGSPLFTGGAGSGESNIRQWIIENDLLDAIIALPTDMFYNTGILISGSWTTTNPPNASARSNSSTLSRCTARCASPSALSGKNCGSRILSGSATSTRTFATSTSPTTTRSTRGSSRTRTSATPPSPSSAHCNSGSPPPRTRSWKSWPRRSSRNSSPASRPQSATP